MNTAIGIILFVAAAAFNTYAQNSNGSRFFSNDYPAQGAPIVQLPTPPTNAALAGTTSMFANPMLNSGVNVSGANGQQRVVSTADGVSFGSTNGLNGRVVSTATDLNTNQTAVTGGPVMLTDYGKELAARFSPMLNAKPPTQEELLAAANQTLENANPAATASASASPTPSPIPLTLTPEQWLSLQRLLRNMH